MFPSSNTDFLALPLPWRLWGFAIVPHPSQSCPLRFQLKVSFLSSWKYLLLVFFSTWFVECAIILLHSQLLLSPFSPSPCWFMQVFLVLVKPICILYSWPWNNVGLNCVCPLKCGFFSVNMLPAFSFYRSLN